MQDKSGKIWFGTTAGLYYFDGKRCTNILDNSALTNENHLTLKEVQCMLQDKKGNIWFGSGLATSEGLIRYDGKTLIRFKPNGDGWVRSIIEDKKGDLWFACRMHGLCVYDGKTFANFTENEGLSENGTGALCEDKSGKIWFTASKKAAGATENGGLWCYDGNSFKNLTKKDGLIHNSIWSIVEDNSSHLWIGTRNMGLSRFDGSRFVSFSE
jgi:ligand-binding sensor domain-containing protein